MELTHAAAAVASGTADGLLEEAAAENAGSWKLDVERGPNWLFVRVKGGCLGEAELPGLAECVCSVMDRHFTYRLVLELQEIELPFYSLAHQLRLLDEWVRCRDGVLRLCGLTPECVKMLKRSRLMQELPFYDDRAEAVWGCRRGRQPR